MKSRLPFFLSLLVLLGVSVLVLSFLSLRNKNRVLRESHYRESSELIALRNNLTAAEKAAHTIADQVRATESGSKDPAVKLSSLEHRRRDVARSLNEVMAANPNRSLQPPVPEGPHGIYFTEFIDEPGYFENVRSSLQIFTQLVWGSWLHHLALPADTRARVEQLLIERDLLDFETEAVALRNGLDLAKNRKEIGQMKTDLLVKLDTEIMTLVGEAGLARFSAQTQIFNNQSLVKPIVQRLSYTAEPLTRDQTNQIIERVLAARVPGAGTRTGASRDVETILTQAKIVFTPAQWDVLQDYAHELRSAAPH